MTVVCSPRPDAMRDSRSLERRARCGPASAAAANSETKMMKLAGPWACLTNHLEVWVMAVVPFFAGLEFCARQRHAACLCRAQNSNPAKNGTTAMTHTSRWFVRHAHGPASFIIFVSLFAAAAEAGPHRARLSRDLESRIASGRGEQTTVIVSGTDADVQALATRYGAVVKKSVRGGAVLEVTGG